MTSPLVEILVYLEVIIFSNVCRYLRTKWEDALANSNPSKLWAHSKVLKLNKNMRLEIGLSTSINPKVKESVDWIIELGDGNLGAEDYDTIDIQIPENLFDFEKKKKDTVGIANFAYSNLLDNMKNFICLENDNPWNYWEE